MTTDERAVTEYRVPAKDLRTGDLVNCSPGGEDDWQEVVSVHTDKGADSATDIGVLAQALGDRYVVVELTDVAPVDGNLYFEDGVAMAYSVDDDPDQPVLDLITEPGGTRTYIYTRYELVTLRAH